MSYQVNEFCFAFESKKDGPTENKKCLCKQDVCSWAQKGLKCPITINEIIDFESISGQHQPGDILDLSNFSGTGGLRSIMREISLTNNGNINFNLNLR